MKIIPFEQRYAPDFVKLNRQWLEGLGLIEDADEKYLDSPRESIIDRGGEIFFAVEEKAVLGTCAAVRHSGEVVEIAKLAVEPSARRRGIGRLLVQTVIDYARRIGARKLWLVSSTRLESALRLYESMGFVHIPPPPQPIYASADVYMELALFDSARVFDRRQKKR